MTVSHIITVLSACDFIDDLKIIEINIEPSVQSIYNGDVIIRRWDNAPHWKNVRTYPFHVQLKKLDYVR